MNIKMTTHHEPTFIIHPTRPRVHIAISKGMHHHHRKHYNPSGS